MENSRKVTHGCIIATLKLFLPDGKEAKASPSIVNSSPASTIPAQVSVEFFHHKLQFNKI